MRFFDPNILDGLRLHYKGKPIEAKVVLNIGDFKVESQAEAIDPNNEKLSAVFVIETADVPLCSDINASGVTKLYLNTVSPLIDNGALPPAVGESSMSVDLDIPLMYKLPSPTKEQCERLAKVCDLTCTIGWGEGEKQYIDQRKLVDMMNTAKPQQRKKVSRKVIKAKRKQKRK